MWSNDLADLSSDRLNNAAETIILGRNYGLPKVLKRAFYEILRTSGLGQDNDDTADDNDEDKRFQITQTDHGLLVRTREKLSQAWFETLSSAHHLFPCPNARQGGAPSDQSADGTANIVACPSVSEKKTQWTQLVLFSGMSYEYSHDVLSGLKIFVDRNWMVEDGYCKDCSKKRKDVSQQQMVSLWKMLDDWLKL